MASPLFVPVERVKRPPRMGARADKRVVVAERAVVDVRRLWSLLRRTVEGDVRFDPGSRGLYAQDASNYYHMPLGVVLPKNKDDLIATIAACRTYGAPVVVRAGGTGLAGQTCNEAVVIDVSKYMRRIFEVDQHKRRARVEPGVICDQLVDAASKYNLTFGPKPATHSHCCFGGMLSNNCGGMHAQYAGIGAANTEAMDVLLYDGTRMSLGWMDDGELERAGSRPGREGEVYRKVRALRDRYAERIRAGYPKLPRRVSGYNLDQLLPGEDGRFNLARAIVGSEGTCVTILDATVRLVDLRPQRVVVVAGYEDVYSAGDHVTDVLAADADPMAVEGMDRQLIENVRKKGKPSKVEDLKLLPNGDGWLLIQIGADDKQEAIERGQRLVEHLKRAGGVVDIKMLRDHEEQESVIAIRESGLGATAFVPGEPNAWPGWEDSAIRPDQVGPYLRDLRGLFQKHGLKAALYGHFGMGCIHCRITFGLENPQGIANFRAFLSDASDMITQKYNGSLSGEHGDGQARSEMLVKMFGPELVQAFAEYKAIWDLDNKMNPGKIVDPYPITANLRLGADYDPAVPETHFKFPGDNNSFAHATLRCVGVGKCRRPDTSEKGGVMCPSYMVTSEERHCTRGRAHLLWELMRGAPPQASGALASRSGAPLRETWHNQEVKESLDLCLSCKGCKNDCPVNVDMATYKAEFLAHYYEGRLRPRHAFAFGWIDKWSRLASIAPGLVNLLTHAPGTRELAKLAANVHPDRSIPSFAPQTFRSWFASRTPQVARGAETVLLFPDTFNNHFHVETAQAAVRVLEHFGFQVEIPGRPLCCGRPLYDFGMLDMARRYLERNLDTLRPYIDAGTPMIVLEPSCCSVFRDEMLNLMPARNEAQKLHRQTKLLSEFLSERIGKDRLPKFERKAIVQGHCHQKSVLDMAAEQQVLQGMGMDHEVLNSGCCGMAGSFGFEHDKFDVAQACGERVLLPRVREADLSTLVMADGFSCRTQIEQNTGRHALHLSQVLQMAIDGGAHAPVAGAGQPVEAPIARARQAALRRSMLRAALGTGAVLGGAVLAAAVLRARGRRSRLRALRWL